MCEERTVVAVERAKPEPHLCTGPLIHSGANYLPNASSVARWTLTLTIMLKWSETEQPVIRIAI
jgi:hypothetical protein